MEKKIQEGEIDKLIESATNIAITEVERLARNVLIKNPKRVSEFCMAMGSYSFDDVKRKDSVMWDHEAKELKGYKKLEEFIMRYDETLKITGEPMRFTATGKVITSW